MVRAVALSSAISSVGFDADVSFVGPGAAHKTLMLAAASDSRTVAPSRNPNRFFMKTSPWHRNKCFQTQRPAFIRCYRENARPARTCTEFMIIANACERSLRLIRIELKLASSVRASVRVHEWPRFHGERLGTDSPAVHEDC